MNKDLWFAEINKACGEAIDSEIKNQPAAALQKYAHCIELIGKALKSGLQKTNATPNEVGVQCMERSKELLTIKVDSLVQSELSRKDSTRDSIRDSIRSVELNGIRYQFEKIIGELDDGITSRQIREDVTAVSIGIEDKRKSFALKMKEMVSSSENPWSSFVSKYFSYQSDKMRRDQQWARELSTSKDTKDHIFKYLKFICEYGSQHPLAQLFDTFNTQFKTLHQVTSSMAFVSTKQPLDDIKQFVATLVDNTLFNHWPNMKPYRKDVVTCLYAIVVRRVFPSLIKILDLQPFNKKVDSRILLLSEDNMSLKDLDVREYLCAEDAYADAIATLSLLKNPSLTIEEYADRLGEAFLQTCWAVEECCQRANIDSTTLQLESNEVIALGLFISLRANVQHLPSIMDLIFEFISYSDISRDTRYAINLFRNSWQWALTFDMGGDQGEEEPQHVEEEEHTEDQGLMQAQEHHDQGYDQTNYIQKPTAQPLLDFAQSKNQVKDDMNMGYCSPMLDFSELQLKKPEDVKQEQHDDFSNFLEGHMSGDWTEQPKYTSPSLPSRPNTVYSTTSPNYPNFDNRHNASQTTPTYSPQQYPPQQSPQYPPQQYQSPQYPPQQYPPQQSPQYPQQQYGYQQQQYPPQQPPPQQPKTDEHVNLLQARMSMLLNNKK